VFLFVYEMFREPLNGFAPNSCGRCGLFLVGTSLKVKGQGHQGQKTAFSAVHAAASVRFMFGKTFFSLVMVPLWNVAGHYIFML